MIESTSPSRNDPLIGHQVPPAGKGWHRSDRSIARRAIEEGGLRISGVTIGLEAGGHERLHELLGLSAAQRVDLRISSEPAEYLGDHAKIRQAIFELARADGNGSLPGSDEDAAAD